MSEQTEIGRITVNVNGVDHTAEVEHRLNLADFLRHTLGLTGTHVGCEHGVCGACTVLVDGRSSRSCLMLAMQADGRRITTIEGLTLPEGLTDLQEAMRVRHGLQCGFCTPGVLVSLTECIRDNENATDEQVRDVLSGHLCRCTGYQNIVLAAMDVIRARGAAR